MELEGVLLADAHYEGACGEGQCGAAEARCTEDDSAPPTEEESDRAFPSTRVALPSETTGALGPGEVNLVRFEVPARCVVKAETTSEIDAVSTLYNADGNRIASGRSRSFSILRLLDAGTYYVRIASNRAGSYMLRLGFEVGDDGHGESHSSAARVALPSETAATIAPFDDEDFFRFNVVRPSVVTAKTLGNTDTFGTLYDAAGSELAADDDNGYGGNFRIRRVLDAGIYYVRVDTSYMDSETGSYVLSLYDVRTPDGATDTPWNFRDCAECPAMGSMPAGEFMMGSPDLDRELGEGPQRRVSIPAFAVSVHEVTFAEWDACVQAGGCGGYRPDDEGWGRGDHPVVNVSWDDALLYVDWLSRSSGWPYRLLSESEWEYAARAGTRTPFHTGRTITLQQANFAGKSGPGMSVPVGSFSSNDFGLYDMHGNVSELVQDCYDDRPAPSDGKSRSTPRGGCWDGSGYSRRVIRGGSWSNSPEGLRSASRGWIDTSDRHDFVGFRVARSL